MCHRLSFGFLGLLCDNDLLPEAILGKFDLVNFLAWRPCLPLKSSQYRCTLQRLHLLRWFVNRLLRYYSWRNGSVHHVLFYRSWVLARLRCHFWLYGSWRCCRLLREPFINNVGLVLGYILFGDLFFILRVSFLDHYFLGFVGKLITDWFIGLNFMSFLHVLSRLSNVDPFVQGLDINSYIHCNNIVIPI